MSLARKSSSADEFYDAVESIEEIPSSSREDSANDQDIVEGHFQINPSLHSVEENSVGTDPNVVGHEIDENEMFEEQNQSSQSLLESANESSTHSLNRLSESDENWASARCLDSNTTESNRTSRESSENWASARCVLEHVPSLMDVVSSSVSNDEYERGERRGILPVEVKASVDPPGERFSDLQSAPTDSNQLVESEPQTSNIDIIQQDLSLESRQSLVSEHDAENNEAAIGDCCVSMEHVNLIQHDQDDESPIGSDADNATTQQVINSEEVSTTQQHDYDIEYAESTITNNEAADARTLNTHLVQTSKEESSCFDRESANGFLPVDSDSITTANSRPLTPTQQDETESNNPSDNAQFSTPLHQNTKRVSDDCSVLDFCDLTSPLETLYLICSNAKRGGGMLKKESVGHLLEDAFDATSPQRFSSSHEVDPKGVAPMSPTEDHNVIPESESDDDSSSAASFSSLNKFRIVDKDTGAVFDVREVMKDIDEVGESTAFDTRYSFLPSKRELQRRTVANGRGLMQEDDDFEEGLVMPLGSESFDTMSSVSHRDSPNVSASKSYSSTGSTSTKKKTKLSDLKSSIANKLHNTTLNRKRTASADKIPRNAIHVKSTSRHHTATNRTASSADSPGGQYVGSSSFNPMLLVKTIPKSHIGPAWCAAFSLDGRFLATGGEDGNVCIWTVAPKSTLHSEHDSSNVKDEKKEYESPKEEDVDRTVPIDIHSPLTLDSDDATAEKVAIDTTPSDEVPPLNFVGSGPELATNLEILSSEPLQRFRDHTADVIDLSWSHTNFLLTASLDSSVRLYHYSKSQCLHLFKHANLVASVAFHPNDERYFLSGGIDKKLRLWSITDGRVKDWAQAPDVITAVRFTPDGKYAVAGLFRGQVYFYDSDGLKYYTQIACRNRSGRYKMGRKVTGISFVRGERDDWKRKTSIPGSEASSSLENSFNKLTEAGSRVVKRISLPFKGNDMEVEALRYTERMLVSTNDSRVRLYGLNDFCLVRKYKGHANYSMQIRARLSESGDFIASGSESGHAFLWKTIDKEWMAKHNISTKLHKTKDKARSPDYFEASKAQLPIVTDTLFFPYISVKEALLSSRLFPFQLSMDRVNDDLSSAAILTLDYDGTMRVFLRKSCIDNLLEAATPRGGHLA